MTQIKNNKGLTIIELLVIVAILGILSAIFIPTITGISKPEQEIIQYEGNN